MVNIKVIFSLMNQEKEKETEKVLLARGSEDLEVALFGISAFRLGWPSNN